MEDFQRRLEVAKVERLESEASILKRIVDETEGSGRLIEEERPHPSTTAGQHSRVCSIVKNRPFGPQGLPLAARAHTKILRRPELPRKTTYQPHKFTQVLKNKFPKCRAGSRPPYACGKRAAAADRSRRAWRSCPFPVTIARVESPGAHLKGGGAGARG